MRDCTEDKSCPCPLQGSERRPLKDDHFSLPPFIAEMGWGSAAGLVCRLWDRRRLGPQGEGWTVRSGGESCGLSQLSSSGRKAGQLQGEGGVGGWRSLGDGLAACEKTSGFFHRARGKAAGSSGTVLPQGASICLHKV